MPVCWGFQPVPGLPQTHCQSRQSQFILTQDGNSPRWRLWALCLAVCLAELLPSNCWTTTVWPRETEWIWRQVWHVPNLSRAHFLSSRRFVISQITGGSPSLLPSLLGRQPSGPHPSSASPADSDVIHSFPKFTPQLALRSVSALTLPTQCTIVQSALYIREN